MPRRLRNRHRGIGPTSPIITTTTDFAGGHHEAILKGIIYSINPRARVISVTSHIRPQDVRQASFIMKAALPFYSYGIHLGIVLPNVDTPGSRSLVVQCKRGILLGPDNGILMPAARELRLKAVYEVSRPQRWLSTPSNLFSAVDIYASLAAHLSTGLRPKEVGSRVEVWVEMDEPRCILADHVLEGEVVFIDSFGNIVTSIPSREVARLAGYNDLLEVELDGQSLRLPLLKSYGYASKGSLLATLNREGLLEIAAYCDNASRLLGMEPYRRVRVRAAQVEEVAEAAPP
ncbi:MAG: S-adenosyl-l-methionine hydroxide adenosyltransferase family protein [Thermoplasmata archaeon]